MRRISLVLAILTLVAGVSLAPRLLVSRTSVGNDFVHFESSHVHPAVMTPTGDRLLVVNTPDNRLTVFDLTGGSPSRIAEIPVGMEPVSVAAPSDTEAWVVNNLSDDVSIVNLNTMHVRKTLRVGDEPSDVVFAGSPVRAYVSVSQEDAVKVYDPADLATSPTVIPMPGRAPRSLARSADGLKVYAAIFLAGNSTSILSPDEIPTDSLPEDVEFPRDPGLPGPAPHVGLIVQRQGSSGWFDMYGNLWNSKIKYTTHEIDVAQISTATNTVVKSIGSIGSVNYALAPHPTDPERAVVVSTEARNLLRFEPRLVGYQVETQAGFVNFTPATPSPGIRKLNPHVNFFSLPGTQTEQDSAIGIPTGVTYGSAGARAYVTALATNKVAVLDPAGGPSSTILARVPCVAGPTGVVVDDARGRLYVVGRFRNQLQTLSLDTFAQVAMAGIGFDPTPDAIVNGRRIFYGGFTSAHGEEACATCHAFGNTDELVWDLGDPFGFMQPPPPGQQDPLLSSFDPMKGPMFTQSLRGLPSTGVQHWRGDRANLAAFNNAFLSLMGRTAPLADSEMTAFSDFVMPLVYPPNPNLHLNRAVADAPPGQPSALRGLQFFTSTPVFGTKKCVDCHAMGTGTNGQLINKASLQLSQDFKVPQLRNLYTKTGFKDTVGAVNKRGFGYQHDGSVDNLNNFLHRGQFVFPGTPEEQTAIRRDLEAFLLAFDTGLAPAVGRQITFDGTNNLDPSAIATLDTLVGQADIDYCDLVAHGIVSGEHRAWVYAGDGAWRPDRGVLPNILTADLRALGGPGTELTVMGVPKGSGTRMGNDRDRDLYLDGDELAAGSDPGDPGSTPANVGVTPGGSAFTFAFRGASPNPTTGAADLHFTLPQRSRITLTVFDVLGREVRRVARGTWLEAGPQSLRWEGRREDGREAAAGVYFVRLQTDYGRQATKTVVRVR